MEPAIVIKLLLGFVGKTELGHRNTLAHAYNFAPPNEIVSTQANCVRVEMRQSRTIFDERVHAKSAARHTAGWSSLPG